MSNPINKPCKYHTARRRFVWRVDSTSSEAPVPTRQFYSTNLFTILFFRQPVLLCNYLLLFSLPNGISPDFFSGRGERPFVLPLPLWRLCGHRTVLQSIPVYLGCDTSNGSLLRQLSGGGAGASATESGSSPARSASSLLPDPAQVSGGVEWNNTY